MKSVKTILLALMLATPVALMAQESSTSTLRRGGRQQKTESTQPGVTTRMQQRMQQQPASDADMSWMKVLYRQLDLTKEANAALYFPEQIVDGNENLFRIIMRLLAENRIPVYEYLDGREIFTDQYRLKVADILDRFHIYSQPAKGSSERNPKFVIEESDVPANEVLSYYVIERWEFDSRTNRMRQVVEAICPVLHRSDDFGMETVKYPMFWVKYSDLRPYLLNQTVFTSDYNNLPSYNYDDYFQLGLYDGEIYKTRNLRNLSMAQQFPDRDKLRHAQDSIQHQLDTFEDKLWVPSLEELEAKSRAAQGDSTVVDQKTDRPVARKATTKRGNKDAKPAKVKRAKNSGSKAKSSGGATRSVRNRKR